MAPSRTCEGEPEWAAAKARHAWFTATIVPVSSRTQMWLVSASIVSCGVAMVHGRTVIDDEHIRFVYSRSMSSSGQWKVLLFGAEADRVGASFVWAEGSDVGSLKAGIEAAVPALRGGIDHCRIAVNGEFASSTCELREGDEVALIGLVSGG